MELLVLRKKKRDKVSSENVAFLKWRDILIQLKKIRSHILHFKFNFSIIIIFHSPLFFSRNQFFYFCFVDDCRSFSLSFIFFPRFYLLPRFSLSAIKKRGGTRPWPDGERGWNQGAVGTLAITATAGFPASRKFEISWMIQIHPGYPVKKIIPSRVQTNLLFNRDQQFSRIPLYIKWKIRESSNNCMQEGEKLWEKLDKIR